VIVRRLELEGLAKLIPRGFAVAGFEQRVRKVLADIGATGGAGYGLFEERDRSVVIARSQGIEGPGEGFVRGIFRFLSQRNGGNQAKRCKPDGALQTLQWGQAEKFSIFWMPPRIAPITRAGDRSET
jgi:hypothetical protein